MIVTSLSLNQFRNFKKVNFSFGPSTTLIVGANGSGKTNILEALFLVSTGKSFRARKDVELISYECEYAKVRANLSSIDGEEQIVSEVLLTQGFVTSGNVQKVTPKKRLSIDGTPKRTIDATGIFKTVVFRPQDMDLITSSPTIRRDFLDTVLSQISRDYKRSILSYQKGVRQRNRLLSLIREGKTNRSSLAFWDQLLIKNGDVITQARREFVDYMNDNKFLGEASYFLEYDPSIISQPRLHQYEQEEVWAGVTLVGPHRDDIHFHEIEDTKKRNLSTYGSRGEQRMAVLWAKLQELNYFELKVGKRPTLLLDDIFSELDDNHREIVESLSHKQQTIMTSAESEVIEKFSGLDIIQL